MNFSKNKLIILILVVVCIVWIAWRSKKVDQPQNLGTVTKGDVVQRVTVAGAVWPNKRSIITAPFNGYVQKLYVKLGQTVKEGDPLFSLSQSLENPEQNHPVRAPFA